jgi:hypothetical protein
MSSSRSPSAAAKPLTSSKSCSTRLSRRQAQHIAYVLNPATLDRYCWPTGTTGGKIAIRELVDKTKWMRRFRGAGCYPVVTLSNVFMNTRFGGRQRTHLVIKRWTSLDAGGNSVPVPALESSATKAEPSPGVKAVAEPGLSEQVGGDEIPPFDDPIGEILDAPSPPTQHKPAVAQKPTITRKGVQKIA